MPITKEASFAETVEQRLGSLKNRTAKVGVIGLGYVGLPLSLLFAEAGFAVTGFDIDEKKVTDLEAGRSYIFRIPEEEIQSARKHGFNATGDFSKLSSMDAIIMCVPTPLTGHREPDLSFIENTARAVAPWLREGQTGCAGEHDLSGNDRRAADSDSREGEYGRPEGEDCREQRQRSRVLCCVLAGARRPGQHVGRAARHSEGCGRA